ncbi:MAG: recombinase family protein, partial [Planctomycetales bacterium]
MPISNDTALMSLMSMRHVVKEFSVSESLVRSSCNSGALKHLKLPSGHRKFRRDWILQWMGIETTQPTNEQQFIIWARVSSYKQHSTKHNKTSGLSNQIERLTAYCRSTFLAEPTETITSITGGLNYNNPKLISLVDRAINQPLVGAKILITSKTRIVRFAWSLIHLLIEEHGGATIIYTEQENEDDSADLQNDLLSVLTHFTSRSNGNRLKAIKEIIMDEDSLHVA